jgi:hypothetical protein
MKTAQKSHFNMKIAALLWLSSTLTAFSQVDTSRQLDPVVLDKVSRLVFFGGTPTSEMLALQENPDKEFVEREWAKVAQEHERRRQEELRNTPGLKPYLFQLLNHYKGDSMIERVLKALSLRNDLTKEDITRIAKDVESNLAKPIDYRDSTPRDYLRAALPILARDLTPENEALLIRALEWPLDTNVNVAAASTLAESGIAKALPIMKETISRFKDQGDTSSCVFIEREMSKLEAKLATEKPETSSPFQQGLKQKPESVQIAISPTNAPKLYDWLPWALALLVGIGGLWFVVRKRVD